VNPGDAITKDSYRQASLLMNQGVLAELADGTGGTLFRNNNNLEAGLASLLAGPQYLYRLAFSTAGVEPNGIYHKLTVKVARDGVHVRARRVTSLPRKRPTKSERQRFGQTRTGEYSPLSE
jgi:hypothetical protein